MYIKVVSLMSRRKPYKREADLKLIADLYLRGTYQSEIAGTLGVTQQTISKDIKEIERRWAERYTDNIHTAKLAELAKTDALEITYWDAWKKSCNQKATKAVEQISNSKTQSEKKSIKQEDRNGSPAFLTGIMNCIERRCKILGLDAPVKVAGDRNNPFVVRHEQSEDLSFYTDEELIMQRTIHENANARRNKDRTGESSA